MAPEHPTPPAGSKSPAFGTASVVFAALTILLPVALMMHFSAQARNEPNAQARAWAWLGVVLAGGILSVIAAGFTSLFGVVTGAVALVRGERRSWLAVLGLIVTVPVLCFLAFVFFATRANGG